jgi:hypothetical protein
MSVTFDFVLMLLNAIFWIGFGISMALGIHPAIPENALLRWTMVILSFICGLTLAGGVILLTRHNKIAYYLVGVLLSAIAVLSITDQIGFTDLSILLITIVAIILLIKDSRWYLPLESN